MSDGRPIIVIKLGALGDFVQAFGPFAAIRRHHAAQRIILLTTAPFLSLAEASGYFDEIHSDGRPEWWRLDQLLRLRKWLREIGPCRVYDLQTSGRSSRYLALFESPKPEWSGIAPGCSHPHANPARDAMHTVDRQAEQLAAAGVNMISDSDMSWLAADTARFDLPANAVLLAPGGAAHRPEKRWPHYAALANALLARDLAPVVIGTREEQDVTAAICAACPQTIDLTGRTSLLEIAGLAQHALGAVGNDTGPMHLIAATGCPSLVLYSSASDPALCGQRGAAVQILRREDLAMLSVEEVEAQLTLR